MRNSPLSFFFERSGNRSDSDLIARASPWRVYLPGIVFSLLLLVITVRLLYVQSRLSDRYLRALQATTTELEVLPARDGRILAGGIVLATDVEQYAVQVHYRWLQADPDPLWMKQQLRKRLSSQERSNPKLVESAQRQLAQERQRLHEQLAAIIGVTHTQLKGRMQSIESRVQRIADSANRRHASATASSALTDNAASTENGSENGSLLPDWPMQMATKIRDALTTPPRRHVDQRIVVREEESWHTVVDDVSLNVAARIAEHPEEFPGTRTLLLTRRTYPQATLAAHVVGAQTRLSDEELQTETQADPITASRSGSADASGDSAFVRRQGRFGVELSYANVLQGVAGIREIVRDRKQQIVTTRLVRQPRSGRDVVLTLDPDLQQHCEHLLAEALTDRPRQRLRVSETSVGDDSSVGDEEVSTAITGSTAPQPVPVGGSIVVMDVHSGQLLAAASAPAFDLNLFVGGSADAWQRVNADQRRPFISRFSTMALPPGSTFKPLTAISALQTETLSARQTFFCQGYLHHPGEHRCLIYRQFGQGHGNLSLTAAMGQSCNVYFFHAAEQMGILPLAAWAERFGLGARTGVDLPFEKSGSLPVTAAMASQPETATRFQRETPGFAIGQSRLTVTPLQMVRMMAAIANGGWLVTPHVISDEGLARRTEDASDLWPTFSRNRIDELSDDTLTAVRRGLTAVCEEPYGTGFKTVRLSHVPVAGKTGTAETSPGKPDHAWFAGYVPADAPQFAFVVVLEHGGSGSHAAGPLAREVVRQLFPAPADSVPTN